MNYYTNIRTNNIKERKKYRGTIRINSNINLNKCMTINLEKKDEDDKIDTTINKKPMEIKPRNPQQNIKFNFNGILNKEEANVYNSNLKAGNIININNFANFDKFKYKNRKLFQEKYCRLNYIFSFSNSRKSLHKDNNDKKEITNNSHSKNKEKSEEKKLKQFKI